MKKKIIVIGLLIILLLSLSNIVFGSVTIGTDFWTQMQDVGMVGSPYPDQPMLILTRDVLGNITFYEEPDPPVIYAQLNTRFRTFRSDNVYADLWIQNVAIIFFNGSFVGASPFNNIWNGSGGDVGGLYSRKGAFGRSLLTGELVYYCESTKGVGGNITYPFSVLLWYNVSYKKLGFDILHNMTAYVANISFYASMVDDGKVLGVDHYDDVEYYYWSKNDNLPAPVLEVRLSGIVMTGRAELTPDITYKHVNASFGYYFKDTDGQYYQIPYGQYYASGTFERVGNVTVYVGNDGLVHVVSANYHNDLPAYFGLEKSIRYVGDGTLYVKAWPSGNWTLAIIPSNVFNMSLRGEGYNIHWYSDDLNDFYHEYTYRERIKDFIFTHAVKIISLKHYYDGNITFHDLPAGNYTAVLFLMINSAPYPLDYDHYRNEMGLDTVAFRYGLTAPLFVHIPTKHVSVSSNVVVPLRFIGFTKNFSSTSNNSFVIDDVGKIILPARVSDGNGVWVLRSIMVNGNMYQEFNKSVSGDVVLPVNFDVREMNVKLSYVKYYNLFFSPFMIFMSASDNSWIEFDGVHHIEDLLPEHSIFVVNGSAFVGNERYVLGYVLVNGKRFDVNDFLVQSPANFTLVVNSSLKVYAFYFMQEPVTFRVYDASGNLINAESIIVNNMRVGSQAYLPSGDYSVSGVVVNGKVYSVNVPFSVSGHAQDVVINLPASQSTSSQHGSSVAFGFLSVLIIIVVLIVIVIVYFKRVR